MTGVARMTARGRDKNGGDSGFPPVGKNDGGEAVLAAILSAAMTARMTEWGVFSSAAELLLTLRRLLIQYMRHQTWNTRFIESRPQWSPNEILINKCL